MSTTFTSEPAPDPAAGDSTDEAERRLVRPAQGRVVAGVAAGLARYFGLSPVVYRVALAALVLLGGSGVVIYVAAWLVIPDETRDASIVEQAIRERRRRPWLLVGVALVAIGLLLGVSGGHLWPNPLNGWLTALAVGLAIVGWQIHEPRAARRRAGSADAAATVPPGRRIPVFLPVVGLLTAAAGVLGILQATDAVAVDWTIALAASVVLVGLAVAAGAFVGGAGWLAALGAVLAAALLAVSTIDVPLRGPVGDRTVEPAGLAALEGTYRQSIGNLQVDLSRVEFPAGTTKVEAALGIGHLRIVVPAGVRVRLHDRVSAGETRVFGAQDSGWKVEHSDTYDGGTAASPTLDLDARVGFGELEVSRG